MHSTIDYPGVRVDHNLVQKRENILPNVRVPARLHFGTMGLAPAESDFVSSIPPGYTGGNIDDWRIGKGARMYYPVAVPGALFSVGDPHAAQGDSELGGTAIETSLTGDFEFILHKNRDLGGTILEGLTHPMLETDQQWSMYGFTFPNYLAELGAERPDRHRQPFEPRQGDARRVPKAAPLPDDGAPHERGRGDRADVGGGGFRRDPGGRRQLGRARLDPEERFHMHLRICT